MIYSQARKIFYSSFTRIFLANPTLKVWFQLISVVFFWSRFNAFVFLCSVLSPSMRLLFIPRFVANVGMDEWSPVNRSHHHLQPHKTFFKKEKAFYSVDFLKYILFIFFIAILNLGDFQCTKQLHSVRFQMRFSHLPISTTAKFTAGRLIACKRHAWQWNEKRFKLMESFSSKSWLFAL